MFPSKHFFFGLIFSLILLTLFPRIGFFGFALILLSTVLIDVDHYLYYIYKKKDISLRNAIRWSVLTGENYMKLSKKDKKGVYLGVYIFHGIEFVLILMFIMFYFNYSPILYLITGITFHHILDLIDLINKDMSTTKVFSLIATLYYIRNKKPVNDFI